jgi:hypothetical protein
VVARGLRRPRGLVFDSRWNLFSGDMTKGGAGALLYVTPHAEFRPPQVKATAADKGRADLLRAMEDGPHETIGAGLGYYDETMLPDQFRRNLLLIDGDKHAVMPVKRKTRSANIAIGRGGRIFLALAYEPAKEGANSELCMITGADDPTFERYDASAAPAKKLWEELGDPSWQRRHRAHVELTRRGGDLLKEANQILRLVKAGDPALHHLIWLAAQSRQGSLHLFALLDHADPLVRVQVIRALTEFPEQLRDEPILAKFLVDPHPQVRHAALLVYFTGRLDWNRAVQREIEQGPARSEDTYLRQTAALLLARKSTRAELETLCSSFDAKRRLAGVLAVGFRLTLPPATQPLAQQLPLTSPQDESVCITNQIDLRKLGRLGQYTIAQHWKADMHTADQYLLVKLLRKMADDTDEPTRAQAVHFLSLLDDRR